MLALAAWSGVAQQAIAQAESAQGKPAADAKPRILHLSAKPAPVPALRYRLFPVEPELTPGDAAPIYIRLNCEMPDGAMNEMRQKADWLTLPEDQFPLADARNYVNRWKLRLEQMAFGAQRQSCNWNYTLPEQKEHSVDILLPDAQGARTWAYLAALKVRVETAEHRYDDAIRSLETGLSYGRHAGQGPFLVNNLVGIAIVNLMLDRIEELVARPDAPNLYWALAALPSPFVSVREAMENEQKLVEWMIPGLADVESPRTEAEWAAVLVRIHARIIALMKSAGDVSIPSTAFDPKYENLARFKDELLPLAKAYLSQRRGEAVAGKMPAEQLIVLYISGLHHDLWDDAFKATYLPFADALPLHRVASERIKASSTGALAFLGVFVAHSAAPVHSSQARLDRRIATLRVVEALRMHAADHGNQLPESLGQVTSVPIPLDPVTGKPFEYQRDGDAATLQGPQGNPHTPALRYTITLRK
jgi:hypothetical protein